MARKLQDLQKQLAEDVVTDDIGNIGNFKAGKKSLTSNYENRFLAVLFPLYISIKQIKEVRVTLCASSANRTL